MLCSINDRQGFLCRVAAIPHVFCLKLFGRTVVELSIAREPLGATPGEDIAPAGIGWIEDMMDAHGRIADRRESEDSLRRPWAAPGASVPRVT